MESLKFLVGLFSIAGVGMTAALLVAGVWQPVGLMGVVGIFLMVVIVILTLSAMAWWVDNFS